MCKIQTLAGIQMGIKCGRVLKTLLFKEEIKIALRHILKKNVFVTKSCDRKHKL